jgi:hypothetical protein
MNARQLNANYLTSISSLATLFSNCNFMNACMFKLILRALKHRKLEVTMVKPYPTFLARG